ncbi:hypothetical protein ACFWQD_01140 [Alcaligenes faecalis]|jgi:hypothetical protein|uniref:hypothetical protein n=1 Tax=Alcaligenes faecalis TaxID=511 RepID=UPI0005A8D9E8|nr:hypothetical protein [Alcaligenes faecalis]MCX5596174.1 hypothetical protein [Alcaligenes faecalis]QQC30989.1 hypothetical protein I6H81_09840 [Alcaligenes faecalis]CAJ0907450.1 Signal peptide protein [Alcaligenes faecalis subsp. faecalis]CUI96973.1 Uncharacterised protein [Alcaligenes faecalis]GAU74210.1 hypothetical protein AFA2_02550 [Alcaligenes faecalis subsp. faecalis NBRC 13111]
MKKLLLAGLMVLGTSTAFAGGVNVDINVGIPGIGYGPIYYPPAHVVERPVYVAPPPVVYHPPRYVYRPGYVEYGRSNKEWRKEQRRAHKRWRKQQERYWDDD